jgi:hypothetical protein
VNAKNLYNCRDKKGGVMGSGTVQIGLGAASPGDAETVWRVIDNLSRGNRTTKKRILHGITR